MAPVGGTESTSTANIRPPSTFNLVGAWGIFFVLPPLVYYMWICAVHYDGALVLPRTRAELDGLLAHVQGPTLTSVAIFGGWFLFQALCQIYMPGPWKEGTALDDGTRLQYRMNGWRTWWLTWAVLGVAVWRGWISASALYDQFGPLLSTVNIFTFGFCIYLYVLGKRDWRKERITGNVFYDYFMGTALNPRNGRFDWKLFCESRPGLIGWVAIDLSLAAKQYELHGHVSGPMIMVCAFHFLYIADYFFHEEAILTTWDIRHENFGWMLCWGDLIWVPFTYTLQAFYLLHHPHELPTWAMVGIVALNMAGYFIFRSTNIQKHHFRTDPERPIWGKKPEYIRTARGSLLLVSGWWGVARHLNYLGDLMMGLAWCLPCGFEHPLPYFYITYFTILLVHRERRDHNTCAEKYGKDWEAYCEKVRWRILPGIY